MDTQTKRLIPKYTLAFKELKFPVFPYATKRNNTLIIEFCIGLVSSGQTVSKSLSRAVRVMRSIDNGMTRLGA